ncbi:MAG: hypothetical protein ACPF9D_13850, partial [Owenweeksia sp.]
MKSLLLKSCLLLWFVMFCTTSNAQNKTTTPSKAVLISPSGAVQFPGGDLKETFGTNYTVGIGAGLKTSTNWIVDGHFHFMFGSQIKNREEILSPILNDKGYTFNQTGNYAQLNTFQRGLYGVVEGSRIFSSLGGVNANSGP